MANHFSALKRTRQTVKRTAVNRASKSRLRSALRELRSAMDEGDKAAAESKLRQATSVLDKSVQKGVVHKNTASRYKARLTVRVAAIASK
jgi:small subunit ribosomal protein S20